MTKNLPLVQFVLAGLFIVLVILSVMTKPILPPVQFKVSTPQTLSEEVGVQTLALPSDTKTVHASFIEPLPDNRQVIFWFGGSREGHKDVQIYRAVVSDGLLTETPLPVLSAPMLSELSGRYIKKLGNPVAKYHDGKLYLWVVSVSVGGWATAKVDLLISEDEGKTFRYGEKLNTSPFFNISTLIRNPIVATEQGFILPAYFELNRLDPIMVRLDENMRMLSTQTLPMAAIQPIVVPNLTDMSAEIFARPITQKTIQHGTWNPSQQSWITQSVDDLPNDSSDSAIVRVSEQQLLMVHNDGEGRGRLLVSLSKDNGAHWQSIKTLENEPGKRFSYPSMIIGSDGMLHITYTYQRKHIQYLRISITSLLAEVY